MINLFDRIAWAKDNLKPVQSDYRVVFEADPINGCAAVLVPDPNWMAAALHGDLLPPVDVYQRFETDENGRITNGHILHETTIAAMSEEEAVEYLVQKDVPSHVWQDTSGNALRLVICRKHQLPQSRVFRNAWTISQTPKQELTA